MIVNLRGTSGSGKTELIRTIMRSYARVRPISAEGRKRPLYYLLNDGPTGRSLAVLGHYETACGGCDTITDMDSIYALVRRCADTGYDVLFEGLLISNKFTRIAELCQERPGEVHVVELTTPLEECLAGIRERRLKRRSDDVRELNPRNTVAYYKSTKKTCERLEALGYPVHRGDRAAALGLVRNLLGFPQ